MSDIAILVDNISKQYRLGQVGRKSIKHDINRWWHTVRGKEDPYLKIGQENDRTKKGTSDYVWALRDVSFKVPQGEVLGIIGRNGAGKSTLLKILSKVTAPTTGAIKTNGRIASLLEVGTGFHPDLSGRDNIYLNGAILGMTKKEITRKFDEIVDFAGVTRYIDTPVKRYSSGMYVRLAFAVAAHLEPEILIVDEVLAVGDAEFQKKCLGKMKDVSEKDGRTILFVSHNMGAVSGLCEKCILLKNGIIELIGDTRPVVNKYFTSDEVWKSTWINSNAQFKNPYFSLLKFAIVDETLTETGSFRNDKNIGVLIEGFVEKINPSIVLGFAIYSSDGALLLWTTNTDKKYSEWTTISENENRVIGWIPNRFLNEGEYRVECIVAIHFREWLIEPEKNSPVLHFTIEGGLSDSPNWLARRPGLLAPVLNYTKI